MWLLTAKNGPFLKCLFYILLMVSIENNYKITSFRNNKTNTIQNSVEPTRDGDKLTDIKSIYGKRK